MFESLAEQIKQDERGSENNARRLAVWAAALVSVLLLFGGVYYATRFIE